MEVALHNKSSIYWGLYQTVRIRQLVWHVCGAGKSGKAGGNILISFRTSVPLAVVLVPHSEAAVCSEEWCRTEARRMAYVCGRVGFLTTYLKRKLRLMISSFFLYACLCVLLTAFKPVSTISWSSVWWPCHWRWPRLFNPLSSTIPKCPDVQTSEVYEKFPAVNVGPLHFVCWQIFKWWTTFTKAIFMINKNYDREGRLEIQLHVLFYGDRAAAFREGKSGPKITVKC
jgi:hypothetical protein